MLREVPGTGWQPSRLQGRSTTPPRRLPRLQAYAEAAAAAGLGSAAALSPEQRWGAACGLVEALGDAASAARLRGEFNNQYRLLRIVDILLQTHGRPLAGARRRCLPAAVKG